MYVCAPSSECALCPWMCGLSSLSFHKHQRAHNIESSLHYNFTEVLNAFTPSPSTPPSLNDLLNDCLSPGHYYKHITHWLRYYDIKQVYTCMYRIIRILATTLSMVDGPHVFLGFLSVDLPTTHNNVQIKKGGI